MPENTIIRRLAPETEPVFDNGVELVPASAFNLSDDDKASEPPLLSVFDKAQTKIDEAKAMMKNPSVTRIAYELNGNDVRGIRIVMELQGQHSKETELEGLLDVVEDPILEGDFDYKKPGYEGHCGIMGLRVKGRDMDKVIRNKLRIGLAKISKRAVESNK